jgi:hypothetical protein
VAAIEVDTSCQIAPRTPIETPEVSFAPVHLGNVGLTYTLRGYGAFFSQTGPVREGVETKKNLPYNPRGEVTQAQYHFIWPNLTLNMNPGAPKLSLDIWLPDGPDHSGFSETYFGPEVTEEEKLEIIGFTNRWERRTTRSRARSNGGSRRACRSAAAF